MEKTLKFGNTEWFFVESPGKDIIDQLSQKYDLHEMIVNDLMEVNVQSKIEKSGKHFFLALSFTKYIPEQGRYMFNELDVIIGEDFIVTTIWLESQSLTQLFEQMAKEAQVMDAASYKASPYYILYRIIDSFYDKTMKSLSFSSQKLLQLQNDISDTKKEIIDDLINEDLNKILIKHNFLSQKEIINDLIAHINDLHEKHLTVYFNDLKVKLSRILNTINVLTEKNDSLMNAYNTFVGIKNNNSVTRLTFVNAIFMPLTLIAGIGWMSERSGMTGGGANYWISYPAFILMCIVIAIWTYFLLKKMFMNK